MRFWSRGGCCKSQDNSLRIMLIAVGVMVLDVGIIVKGVMVIDV